jgi:hypothetical protein
MCTVLANLTLHTELRRRLLEAEPDLDEQTLLDTLEGATDLDVAIGALVRSALLDGAYLAGLKARIEEMRERLARIEARMEKKRALALETMEAAGIARITEPDFTITLRASPPSVLITDEQSIPEWFWIPQPARLDKRGLLEALKGGSHVSGAELSNPHASLSVRTR